MATVRKQRKSARSKRVCDSCNREIETGEEYLTWTPYRAGRRVRCLEHPPSSGDLTMSKMSTVYDAIDSARSDFGTVEETRAAVEGVAEAAREVVEEYREAAEHFGGSGPSAEKADELEGWVDELEQFEPEESEETEFDEDEYREMALERVEEDGGITFADAMQQLRDEWETEHGDDSEELAEKAREAAEDILSSCPL